jgi:alpha-beta hydrolase superfamily lysophospholipase
MAEAATAAYTLQWYADTDGPVAGVALVLHGLNVNPQRMKPLEQALNSLRIAALSFSLMGHGANYLPVAGLDEQAARLASFGRVTRRLWLDEVTAACAIAAQRAAQQSAPLFLLGFSLGGLLGCAAALTSSQVRFDRLVLLAPALAIHRRSKVLMTLARWPQLVIPSATPAAYRANPGTTMAAYNALYAAQAECERRLDARLNAPALIFVDPQDELVSATGLEQLVAARNLTHWQIHPVHKGAGAQTRYHHLLIDAASVGPDVWRGMMARMAAHLAV